MMNIQLHAVISNITGKTGTSLVEAIISGERKPENFLPLVQRGIKAHKDILLKSLQANWRTEQLFLLEQSYRMYQFTKQQIGRCEQQIEEALQNVVAANEEGIIEQMTTAQTPKPRRKSKLCFKVRPYLHKIHGVEVTAI